MHQRKPGIFIYIKRSEMALHKKIAEKKSAMPLVGYKSFSFAIKAPKIEGRTVTGYLAAFNNIDTDGDLLIKGCFAKSLTERGVDSTAGNKIAHLWQHKMDEPIGNYTVLKEDDYGLYFEAQYDDVPKANQALTQFKSGTLNNFSIGYGYVWDKMEYDEEQNCIVYKEINLYEGSVVTLAANPMAMYTGLKSEQKANEIQLLKEEIQEIISGLKPRKRFELAQIFDKLSALSTSEPQDSKKQALKEGKEPPKKKSMFAISS